MITPEQCRTAREVLGWNQRMLAKAAGIALGIVSAFEAGLTKPRMATLHVVRLALETAGDEFTPGDGRHGPGVRLRKPEAPRAGKT